MGEQTFTFLGRVPVKCQPGEVEHSYQPAVSAEGIHEDDTAGHSWGGGQRITGQPPRPPWKG